MEPTGRDPKEKYLRRYLKSWVRRKQPPPSLRASILLQASAESWNLRNPQQGRTYAREGSWLTAPLTFDKQTALHSYRLALGVLGSIR
jgi:hypothetical protein